MTEHEIATAAIRLTDPDDRSAYLDRTCAGDSHVRRQVERLLAERQNDVTQAVGTNESPADDVLRLLSPPTRPGSLGRLGQYEILSILGRGGFGTVVRAFDDVLRRTVAVKLMAPHLASSPDARLRFLREARAGAAVRHENVVAVYGVGEQPVPHLVMEYVEGQTLQQRLEAGPLPVAEVIRLGRQIAAGLAAAHTTGLIHRDVKPGNILIENGPEPRARLTDFGLARAAEDVGLTQSGVIVGTPLYLSPEQANSGPLDHRSDLFSLGSVLYATCAGRPPFLGPTTLGVLRLVAEGEPPLLRSINPEVPPWLCDVVARLHSKDPSRRFASASEVAELLANPPAAGRKRSGFASLLRWAGIAALVLVTCAGGVGVWHRATTRNRQPPEQKGESPPLAVAPFEAARAKELQQAWADHLGVPVELTNSLGMKLRLIPPGEFTMGSSDREIEWLVTEAPGLKDAPDWMQEYVRSEGPQRRVTIREPFRLGAHEVTVGQFREFVRATNYRTEVEERGGGVDWDNEAKGWRRDPANVWTHPKFSGSESHPVGFVTPADARSFCAWLSEKEGARYALPAEEQWEYACRAGTDTRWWFGDDAAKARRYGWSVPYSEGTHKPVGRLLANPFGLFDVHGNSNEFVVTPQGQFFERGGSAGDSPFRSRSAWRHPIPDVRDSHPKRGFRVAMMLGEVVEKADPLPTEKSDLERMKGVWRLESLDENNRRYPKERIDDCRFAFDGRMMRITGGPLPQEGEVKLEPTAWPRQIDFAVTRDGLEGNHYGIYKFEGDTLTLCVGHSKQKRPRAFEGGSDQLLWILRRQARP